MESKICSKCNIPQPLCNFAKDSTRKEGIKSSCKSCRKLYNISNKDSINNKAIEYYNNHKESRSEYQKVRRLENPEYYQIYYKNYNEVNKEAVEINRVIYYNKNKKDIIRRVREYTKNRYHTDELFRIKLLISKSIQRSFKNKGLQKSKRTREILGCSFEEFKLYLESKFESWMNWGNQGKYNGELNYGWDVDHILPLSLAKTEEEIIKLNHFSNLQPLCSKVNRDIKWKY